MRRKLTDRLGVVAIFGAVVLALIGFHFWGESQRYREWWWVGGSSTSMLFLDLADSRDGEGHLLTTFVQLDDDGARAHEFDVRWACSSGSISWGEMWALDDNMRQIERRPSPREMRTDHRARSASERLVLQVACARAAERARMRTVRIERSPIEVTNIAHRLLDEGIAPFGALMLAAYDPERDSMMYERIVARFVQPERIARVRELTGSAEE